MAIEIVEEDEIVDSNLIKLYMNSFPAVERRPIEKLNEMVKNDEKYHLYIVKADNSIIGFALVCELPDEKVALLDYMVINDSFQRKGIGSKLLQYCIDSMQSKDFLGLLLEIQIENVDDSDEQKIRKDRIHFYKKFGAKTFENVEYYIPPQSGTVAEKMHLMIIPFNELDDFSKKSVEDIVRKMHLEIYHSKRIDLVEKTVQSLTENIKLI
jgi:ribosomal protein S18 acetylase RimI-like enzyme